MSNKGRVLFCCVLLVGLGLSTNAIACSVDNWNVKSNITNTDAGSPPPVGTTARYEEICGLAVTATSYVGDESPIDGEDTRIRLRFHVRVPESATGTVKLLEAFDDDAATTSAFSISWDADNEEFDFSATGVATSSYNVPDANIPPSNPTPVGPSGLWHEIQVDWEAGGGFRYWVNTEVNGSDDNQTGSLSGAGTTTHVGLVRMGAPDGIGDFGILNYDSYQANRMNSVPSLTNCDADGSAVLSISDIIVTIGEVYGDPPVLASGQPDCDRNGAMTLSDIITTIEAVFPPAP
jgi:hypothetical protein